MDRRRALRVGAALSVGALGVTGCDSSGTHDAPPGTPSHSAPPGTPPHSAVPGNASPGTGTGPGALPPEVTHGPRDQPRVALTFHGQGETALVEQLLAGLEAGGAHGTILAVGSWLAAVPQMARRIMAGGHELGNHTQHHLAIAQLSRDGMYAEIDECAQLLRRLTGSIGTWFRPSQTQYATAAIQAQATRVGYRTCLSYDIDSRDFMDPGPVAVLHNTTASIRNGSIVSLHCGHPGTVTALPAILDTLRGHGLRAVTMTELMS